MGRRNVTVRRVTVGELIRDLDLYPRRKLSDHLVARYREALRAGASFPRIVVDESLRIIDGWHRAEAYEREFGPGHVIEAEVRTYASDREAFLDAARLNAAHGESLSRADQIRVATHARSLGASDEEIAVALQVEPEQVQRLTVRVVFVRGTDEPLPSKPVSRHLEGRRVTVAQARAIDRGPGIAPLRLVRDLKAWLTSGVLDVANRELRTELRELAHLILARVGEAESESA